MANFIICEDKAPPVVFDILRDLNTEGEAEAFIDRTVTFAKNCEDLLLEKVDGQLNSRLSALMVILMAKSNPERARMLSIESDKNQDFISDVDDDTPGWTEICVAITFASDELLDRMIAQISLEVMVVVISQIPEPTRTEVRKKFMN